MSLIRWSPARDLVHLNGEMESMLDDLLGGRRLAGADVVTSAFLPPVDVHEGPESWVLKMELPGTRMEDVNVSIEGDVLTVSGEKKSERQDGADGAPPRVERVYGAFSRSFTLPGAVRQEKIRATLREGVLAVELPKADEVKPRQIAIEAK